MAGRGQRGQAGRPHLQSPPECRTALLRRRTALHGRGGKWGRVNSRVGQTQPTLLLHTPGMKPAALPHSLHPYSTASSRPFLHHISLHVAPVHSAIVRHARLRADGLLALRCKMNRGGVRRLAWRCRAGSSRRAANCIAAHTASTEQHTKKAVTNCIAEHPASTELRTVISRKAPQNNILHVTAAHLRRTALAPRPILGVAWVQVCAVRLADVLNAAADLRRAGG